MFTFVANIPIFRRLFYAFLLAAVIPAVIISVLGAIFVNGQNSQGRAMQADVTLIQDTASFGSSLQSLNEPLNDALNQYQSNNAQVQGQTAETLGHIRTATNDANTALKQYLQNDQIATSPQMSSVRSTLSANDPPLITSQQNALNTFSSQTWPAYMTAQGKVINAIDSHVPVAQIHSLLSQADQKYTLAQKQWNAIKQLTQNISSQIAQVGPSQTNPVILATVVSFLSTIMVVIAIGYVVNLTITRPLRQLATLTKRIAKGETTARAKLLGRDEIYMVANSMNNMLDNIVRLIQETQSQRDVLQAQVEKLVSEVSGVGEGDLRVQAEVTADALGVLADSFNYMVEELGSLVVRVKTVSSEVERSTTAILDRMTQLVETGDAEINQIAEAAIEVEHMAGSSRQVAERSQVLYDVARVARQDAQVGRESVLQAVEGMGRINENVQQTASKVQTLGERSREINEIVEAISSIAHQTNRLALDAAIQAAMAGENGKGFGAVAADIRRLAERAKEQAGMITRIVRSVREDIGAVAVSMQDTERETSIGTQLTQEAGSALEAIFAAVEHQAREIESINQMAMQQLQSSSAVVQIMHAVSESTQQSGLSTREASQNMERLARLVEQLRASTEAFKLREDQDYYVPNANLNMTIEEEADNPLTVSGVFRTVSATAQPARLSSMTANTLLPERSEDPFSFYPTPSAQLNQRPAWEQDSLLYGEANGNGKKGMNW